MPEEITAYAGFPDAVIYQEPVAGKNKGKKGLQHLVWGDWLKVKDSQGEWRQVHARGVDGWMHQSAIQPQPLLEVNFVDIGQGDGCFIVTPDNRFLLVDAGDGDNMYRFLRWRFGKFRKNIQFEAAVISHPDKDHYYGFQPLFREEKVTFKNVYHNGIMERLAEKRNDSLGPKWKDPASGTVYLTDLVKDPEGMKRLAGDPALTGDKFYPSMLRDAINNGKIKNTRQLCHRDRWMPGFEADRDLRIQILGPVVQEGPGGELMLPWLRDVGKTKNGHSVVLKMIYKDVSILLGGDLNIPAEAYLLSHYTGMEVPPTTAVEEEELVRAARQTFAVDIAKSCHHGSPDFSELFIQALDAAVTVVSSGDDEPYCHPRPETLGAIGKYSRGQRPLIFSTELSRSAPERIKHPYMLRQELKDLQKAIDTAATPEQRKKAQQKFEKGLEKIERSVAIYGMISLRTDGEKVVMAHRLEKARSASSKWDLSVLEPGPGGRLRYLPRHTL
jgi:beta-lactamase superfamily II metal-dependent hydrolase